MRVGVILNRQRVLFEVVRALHPTRGLAGRLNRRKEQTDQDTDDRDDDQQFDEGKTA